MAELQSELPPTPKQNPQDRQPCPEETANIFYRIFLLWVVPLIRQGYKEPLQDANLWELRSFERGANTTALLSEQFKQKNIAASINNKPKNRLESAIFAAFAPQLAITAFIRFIDITLFVIQPILLNQLITFLQSDPPQPVRNGYIWAAAMFLAPLVKTTLEAHYFSKTMRTGMRVRSALQGMLYDKSLMLSPSARASASVGEIVNLMQLDSQRIGDSVQLIHTIWSAPVQIIVSVGLLYNYIGVSALIGFALSFASIPLQGTLFKKQISIRVKTLKITDKRVKLVNEVLQGIKAVKFYAWEKPFSKIINVHRQDELQMHRSMLWVTSGIVSILFSFPLLIAVVTFAFYTGVFNQELDPAKVFTGIALLNQLRIPIMMLPMVVVGAINARLGIKRIERLLDLEDIDNYSRESSKHLKPSPDNDKDKSLESSSISSDQPPRGFVSIKNGEFAWSPVESNPLKQEKKKKGGLLSSCLPGKKKKDSMNPDENGKGPSEETVKGGKDPSSETAETESSSQKEKSSHGSTLKNINAEFTPAKLHAVVGNVGSGKSSLLHAILGEMKKVEGHVVLEGTVAHVAQTAWIFHDTLRNNITFGKEFDEDLYNTAIDVSGLEPDIAILPNGDQTSIGERGVNLSGGQKQRVSIARAVYAQADVYLFDDPLSALDAHVSQYVFEKCISNKGVLNDKLRILITNQVHVLPDCDTITFLDAGDIKGQGSYDELRNANEGFNALVKEQEQALKEQLEDEKAANITEEGKPEHAKQSNMETKKTVAPFKLGKSIMQNEEREIGSVGYKLYLTYFRSLGSPVAVSAMMFLFLISTALSFVVQWWLTYWSEETIENENPRSEAFFLSIYFGLSILFALLTFFRSVWLQVFALNAAEKLHTGMLGSVLHAPLTFFDTTPVGRILSRFSRDVAALDEMLPQVMQQVINTSFSLLLTYVFIGIILPPFFGVAIPVIFVYLGIMFVFKRTIVELKRLDNVSKSPIYAQFSETLGGLSTIRAYGKQDAFRKTSLDKIDLNQRAFFLWIMANRLFTLCLEYGSSVLVFATALFGVISRGERYAGAVALALTYSLQVTSFLGFAVRAVADLEGQMNSVERANFYIKELPQEAATEIEGAIPEEWPSKGEIEFQNVELRYREGLPLVLRGISANVKSGEKVGVVGRTGSGKSSLMIALLRMVELSNGKILVDGVDLKDIGLDDVRSKITIIPQDPVMFSGTIRLNLDPFGQFSDAELWDALEKSHLKQFVSTFEEGLDAPVSEYGENLSAGQRQIICLTRALLRKSKILILDEASSSLDEQTDKLVQKTIREHLGDATILTIAHRLLTLVDYDKIIVLADGEVAEIGSPSELLQKEGIFNSLVESLGASGAALFRRKVKT